MKLVVVTGASRSGTTFLGGLLACAENATSEHEYLTSREFSYISYYNPSHPALRRDLEARIASVERSIGTSALFVDVNCNLAFGVDALRQAKPDVKIFHLVRDGRSVVASNWLRKMYTSYSKGISLVPNTPGELSAWDGYDRFQRLCWQWNQTVSHLLDEGLPVVRLEQLLEDFDYLKSQLLDPAGIVLSRAKWEANRREKANGSRFKLSDFFRGRPMKLEWTTTRKRQFDEICGATMQRLGYSHGGAVTNGLGDMRMALVARPQAAE